MKCSVAVFVEDSIVQTNMRFGFSGVRISAVVSCFPIAYMVLIMVTYLARPLVYSFVVSASCTPLHMGYTLSVHGFDYGLLTYSGFICFLEFYASRWVGELFCVARSGARMFNFFAV
ncbi:uncharacterized protein LOC131031249 [Cryptomeria japonica]|uniref:uncharacterized protein LOC131031249 n=1 Tax=Cryptomeria japonica TaxID=3369 RepID=UPI0025AD6D3B|nr:uncharacterized protein LOC131031249 [Cryptomeria japonica]